MLGIYKEHLKECSAWTCEDQKEESKKLMWDKMMITGS